MCPQLKALWRALTRAVFWYFTGAWLHFALSVTYHYAVLKNAAWNVLAQNWHQCML